MQHRPNQTTRRQLRRPPLLPSHRLVGAGFTALVLWTPLPAFGAESPQPEPPATRQPAEGDTAWAGSPDVSDDAGGVTTTITRATGAAPTTTDVTPSTTSTTTAMTSTTATTTSTSTTSTSAPPTTTAAPAPAERGDQRVLAELDPPNSPDVGASCASGLDSDELSEFMGNGIGDIGGADYQRAIRLPDDRVLWTFQDAFVNGRIIHNVGVIQSGRCFTRIGPDDRSWLLSDATEPKQRWHWILDGVVSTDGSRIELFVVEMHETGRHYLSRTRPSGLHRVALDTATLGVVEVVEEPWIEDRLYGWSVTSDDRHTYLYSHCYQQFGYDTMLGFAECASDVTVARVDRGDPGGERTYWNGTGWSADPSSATPVVDTGLFFAGNNPAQIRFTGERFELIEKRGDWFGETVEFATADEPFGPFEPAASVTQPLPCAADTCNSYFATWVPWQSSDGTAIWMISHNRWDGTETIDHLEHYRPSFHTVQLPR